MPFKQTIILLSYCWVFRIFCQPVADIFLLLKVSFTEQKFLILIRSNLSIFSLLGCPLDSTSGTLCLTQGQADFVFFYMFYSFTFMYMIYFEFIFYMVAFNSWHFKVTFFNCLIYFLFFNFFKFIYFILKDNCFTEFCCFLSNLNMNQP